MKFEDLTLVSVVPSGKYGNGTASIDCRYGKSVSINYEGSYDNQPISFRVDTLYHKEDKSLDFMFGATLKWKWSSWMYCTKPETLILNNNEDEELLLKMMYSFSDYIRYIIEKRGNIQAKLDKVCSIIHSAEIEIDRCIAENKPSETVTKFEGGRNTRDDYFIDMFKFDDTNKLQIEIDYDKYFEDNEIYEVPTYKIYKGIKIIANFTFKILEETTDKVIIKYEYTSEIDMYDNLISDENLYITLKNIERHRFTDGDIFERLIEVYGVADEIYQKQMNYCDRILEEK
jgi:hypothetical protein